MNNSGYVVRAKTQEGDIVLPWDYAATFEHEVTQKLYLKALSQGIQSDNFQQYLKELGWDIVKFEFTVVD
jgi:hypothetical protein